MWRVHSNYKINRSKFPWKYFWKHWRLTSKTNWNGNLIKGVRLFKRTIWVHKSQLTERKRVYDQKDRKLWRINSPTWRKNQRLRDRKRENLGKTSEIRQRRWKVWWAHARKWQPEKGPWKNDS